MQLGDQLTGYEVCIQPNAWYSYRCVMFAHKNRNSRWYWFYIQSRRCTLCQEFTLPVASRIKLDRSRMVLAWFSHGLLKSYISNSSCFRSSLLFALCYHSVHTVSPANRTNITLSLIAPLQKSQHQILPMSNNVFHTIKVRPALYANSWVGIEMTLQSKKS